MFQPMKQLSRALLAIAVSAPLVLISQSGPAFAQTDEYVLEEIIVTATRREVALQDVPQSITALTGETLQLMGADEFMDYAASVPGVAFISTAPGQTTITMRGISSSRGVATVGVYQDETPITSREGFGNNQPNMKLFDSERVEILRGPQGTLYGESSLGGTIRVITKQPDTSAFGLALDSTYTDTKDGGTGLLYNAMLNIPVVEDKFALRLVGYHRDVDGWIDNSVTGQQDVNDEDTTGFRATALWSATDNLDLTFSYSKQDMDLGDENVTASDSRDNNFIAASPSENELELSSLVVRYDFPSFQLMSSTSQYEKNDLYFRSVPQSFIDFFEGVVFMVPPGSISSGNALIDEGYEIFTQEIRLISTSDGPLQWTTGLYYNDADIRSDFFFGFFVNPALVPPFPPEIALADSVNDSTKTHKAIYAEGVYSFSEKLDFTLGARWFDEEFDTSNVSQGSTKTADGDSSDVLFKGTLSYAFNDDSMGYFTISEGYRSGGINLSVVDVEPNAPAIFDPDSTINYELGGKLTLFGGRVFAAFAAYYIDWTDVQVVVAATPPNIISFTDNLGEAHATGVELEVEAHPTDRLTISFGGNWVEAEVDKDVPEEGVSKGDRLVDVPETTAFASVQYDLPFANGSNGYARAQYNYVDERITTIGLTPNRVLPSYSTLNLRLGLQGERWYGSVFVNNATDEYVIVSDITFITDTNFYETRPRTVGLNIGYKF